MIFDMLMREKIC